MIIPVMVGEVDIVSKKFEKRFKKLKTNFLVPLFQKVYLLGTGKILRRVLDT